MKRHLLFEIDGLVHARKDSTNMAHQTRCWLIGIYEEFEPTNEAVTCLECLAEEHE